MFIDFNIRLPIIFTHISLVGVYPLGMTNIAMENDHKSSGFFPLKMVIFHSYVKLPEGNQYLFSILLGGDWNMNVVFPEILGRMVPTDETIFFIGVETTNQYMTVVSKCS